MHKSNTEILTSVFIRVISLANFLIGEDMNIGNFSHFANSVSYFNLNKGAYFSSSKLLKRSSRDKYWDNYERTEYGKYLDVLEKMQPFNTNKVSVHYIMPTYSRRLNHDLHVAIRDKNEQLAVEILDDPALATLTNALQNAAGRGLVNIVKLLLDKSPCIDERFGNDEAAIHFTHHLEGLPFIKTTGPTSLIMAATCVDRIAACKIAELLLAKNADVNAQADMRLVEDHEYIHYSNVAALHYAAAAGDEEMVKLLLKHGALIDIQNAFGETPLLLAVWKGHAKVVKILRDHGADPNKESGWNFPMSDLTTDNEILALLQPTYKPNCSHE